MKLHELIIQLVQERELLYSKTHPDYMMNDKRKQDFEDIANIIQTEYNMQVTDIK